MTGLEIALLLVVGVATIGLAARRLGLPSPVLLIVAGVVVAVIPGVHTVHLDPELVLVAIIPPLLYSAALDSSLLEVKANLRPIGLLSVGLVLVTALTVGVVMTAVVPGLSFAAACTLGAIVAPPDAVAAIAVGRRVGMPTRLATLVEGEGMLNDATALVSYNVAVAATVSGGFSLADAGLRFLLAAAGGVVVGAVVALAVRVVRKHLDDELIENTLSVVTPFAAYVPAEQVGASGVLAVVVTGLILGHRSTELLSGGSRLQTHAVWRLVTFLLEGAVFLLIGLQLRSVVAGLSAYSVGQLAGWSAVLVAVVLLIRPLWIFPATYLPRMLSARVRERDPSPGWQFPAALSWAGMRGVVSLAAAFAIPLTTDSHGPFPQRDLLLFLVFVVIATTLVGQSLTFGWVLRALGLRADRTALLLQQATAQQTASRAGLDRLMDLLATETHPLPDGIEEKLTRLAERRQLSAWERLGERGPGRETPSAAYRRLRAEMISAERSALTELRDRGQLSDEAMRELQHELDLEEVQLGRT